MVHLDRIFIRKLFPSNLFFQTHPRLKNSNRGQTMSPPRGEPTTGCPFACFPPVLQTCHLHFVIYFWIILLYSRTASKQAPMHTRVVSFNWTLLFPQCGPRAAGRAVLLSSVNCEHFPDPIVVVAGGTTMFHFANPGTLDPLGTLNRNSII